MEIATTRDFRVQVQIMPRDLHSMFASFFHQMSGISILDPRFAEGVRLLRKVVADALYDSYDEREKEDQKWLLESLRNGSLAGDIDCLRILSAVFKVRIVLLMENALVEEINANDSEPGERSIFLFVRAPPDPRPYVDSVLTMMTDWLVRDKLKLGTWHVDDCRDRCSQDLVDESLHIENVDVACLQQTQLLCGETHTAHYHWINFSGGPSESTCGVSVLVRHGSGLKIVGREDVSDFLGLLAVDWRGNYVAFISAYVPPDSPSHMAHVDQLLRRLANIRTVVAGNFNARIGKDEYEARKSADGPKLLGKTLMHLETNANGKDLLQLAERNSCVLGSTFAKNKSWGATYREKVSETAVSRAQIDHILLPVGPVRGLYHLRIAAKFDLLKKSNHALLECDLRLIEDNPLHNAPEKGKQKKKKSKQITLNLVDANPPENAPENGKKRKKKKKKKRSTNLNTLQHAL